MSVLVYNSEGVQMRLIQSERILKMLQICANLTYSMLVDNRSAVIQNVPGQIWQFFNSPAKTRRAILYHFLTV